MKKVKLKKDGASKEVLEHVVNACLDAGWEIDKPKASKPKKKEEEVKEEEGE